MWFLRKIEDKRRIDQNRNQVFRKICKIFFVVETITEQGQVSTDSSDKYDAKKNKKKEERQAEGNMEGGGAHSS